MRGVSRTVVLLGLTSMFTDISAEMVSTTLPLYLIYTLGLAPLQFGVIDGLYQGGAVLVRIASGLVSDRTGSPKRVAVAGYALSALTKVGLLVGQGAGAVTALVVADRVGKGIRTAPRDAMIARATEPARFGTAFGVHRALDSLGAMIGPLLAFAILLIVPGAFDAVFVVSFCVAIIGLAVLVLFVQDARPSGADADSAASASPAPDPEPRLDLREMAAALAEPRFRSLVVAGAALSVLTISDAFVYLVLQSQLSVGIGFIPLMFVATALVYLVLAIPAGRLADRIGRDRVFLGGYLVLGGVYATLLVPGSGPFPVIVALTLLGAFYAMTDGVLAAFASEMLPAGAQATGLGVVAGGTGLARLVASVLFGLAWSVWNVPTAVAVFLAGLLIGTAAAAILLGRAKGPRLAGGALA